MNFPNGYYQHRPEWSWLWSQLQFCLPFNDPVANNGLPFGAGAMRPFQCWDVAHGRMGAGGTTSGHVLFHPRRFQGSLAEPQHVGNVGVEFINPNSSTSGTAGFLYYDPTSGGLPLPSNTNDGMTMALVFHDLSSNGKNRRLFHTNGNFFGSELSFEGLDFGPTAVNWVTFLTNLSVPHLGQTRSVWVFTGRKTVPGFRAIYQDGILLGTDTTAPIGMGDMRVYLAIHPTFRGDLSANGILDLLVVTNRFWTDDRVRQFSANPFGFLVPRQRRRPPALAEIDPCEWFNLSSYDWETMGLGADWFADGGAPWLLTPPVPDWFDLGTADWFAPKEC